MSKSLIVGSILLFILGFGLGVVVAPIRLTNPPAPLPQAVTRLDGEHLLGLVNNYRVNEGLSPIRLWASLCEYASERDIEIRTDWSHDGWRADVVSGRLGRFCTGCGPAGENLAKGFETDEQVLGAWIASPEHKANLDNPAWNIGCVAATPDGYVSLEVGGSTQTGPIN